MQEEVRGEVKWFASEMELVLKLNDHKGGWQDCSIRWLFKMAEYEMTELYEAIHRSEFANEELEPYFRMVAAENLIKEAVDVANFAMMIADKARVIADKAREAVSEVYDGREY